MLGRGYEGWDEAMRDVGARQKELGLILQFFLASPLQIVLASPLLAHDQTIDAHAELIQNVFLD
ncbi:MAG: hypothetical protein BGO78_12395 [Chloroflexi bacterium 44-23]|nr:MAG: hypothetical protein BGO78_12395 [Chloroflexi bacterium 44-23]